MYIISSGALFSVFETRNRIIASCGKIKKILLQCKILEFHECKQLIQMDTL